MKPLAGKRILLVEDNYIIAMDLRRMIAALGAEIIGPANSIKAARALVGQGTRLDGAILDVRLDGGTSLPLAEELTSEGIPVILATGLDAAVLPEQFSGTPKLTKPYNEDTIRRITGAAFGAE